MCVGEMRGHTGQINVLMKVSETAFVSGSHDSLIILWRHCEDACQYTNTDAVYNLVEQNPRFLRFTPCPAIHARFSDAEGSSDARDGTGEEDEEEYQDAETEYDEGEYDDTDDMDYSDGTRGADEPIEVYTNRRHQQLIMEGSPSSDHSRASVELHTLEKANGEQ